MFIVDFNTLDMLNSFHLAIDFLQPIATEIIALIAVLGFLNTRWLWKQSNRPIVSAFVETNTSGNIATLFDLTVINSGNRPAIDIKLKIDDDLEFQKCLDCEDSKTIEPIKRCFDADTNIPLLINGAKVSNYFGATSVKSEQNIWKYGSSFSITINYKDLEKRKYCSNLILYIKDSKAFAGGSWSE